MRTLAIVTGAVILAGGGLRAETAQERLQKSAEVFNQIMSTPDKGIPQNLLEEARCVVIVPDMKKAAIGIGGQYGRGFAMCREQNGIGWSAPSAVRMEGGSFGLQIGATSTDLVLLVMNKGGMDPLLQDKFTIGADASAAAGPVGRSAKAATDAQLGAEILAWSRSKGAFAGVSLSGTTLRNDLDENKELYGRELTNKEVLTSNMQPPPAARPLISALEKYPPSQGSDADRSNTGDSNSRSRSNEPNK